MKVKNTLHPSSNNYDKLFHEQMKNPEFVKAYNEAQLERRFIEILEDLKDKIIGNEPREVLLETINTFQHQI